jgi:mannose/fructose/N-acetylgalactosamine-specific phosphotransferase system component IIB
MVKLLRVDERLLHGQVALNWVQNVGASSILIGNDEVVNNDVGKMALKMAKPSGSKLAIKSIEGAAELLNDPRSKDISIFAIVRTIADALRLAKLTDEIKAINIGGVKKKEGSKMIAAAIFINNEDIANLRELQKRVEKIEFRMLPADSPKSLESVMKEN